MQKRYFTLSDIPKHIFQSIYAELTLDASADQNPSMDDGVRQALFGNDPDMITDLRHLNKGRPNDTFNVFYEQLEKQVDEMQHKEHLFQVRVLCFLDLFLKILAQELQNSTKVK